jgi:hypothetical protein
VHCAEARTESRQATHRAAILRAGRLVQWFGHPDALGADCGSNVTNRWGSRGRLLDQCSWCHVFPPAAVTSADQNRGHSIFGGNLFIYVVCRLLGGDTPPFSGPPSPTAPPPSQPCSLSLLPIRVLVVLPLGLLVYSEAGGGRSLRTFVRSTSLYRITLKEHSDLHIHRREALYIISTLSVTQTT